MSVQFCGSVKRGGGGGGGKAGGGDVGPQRGRGRRRKEGAGDSLQALAQLFRCTRCAEASSRRARDRMKSTRVVVVVVSVRHKATPNWRTVHESLQVCPCGIFCARLVEVEPHLRYDRPSIQTPTSYVDQKKPSIARQWSQVEQKKTGHGRSLSACLYVRTACSRAPTSLLVPSKRALRS